jgi:hypothetical protein
MLEFDLNPTVRTRKHEVVSCSNRKQSVSHKFEDHITAEKTRLEAQIAKLPPGPEREVLRRKIRQLETARHINDWALLPNFSHRSLVSWFAKGLKPSK